MTYTDPSYRAKSGLTSEFDSFPPYMDHTETYQFPPYPPQMSNVLGPLADISDLTQIDSMDFDFNTYVQQPEVMT